MSSKNPKHPNQGKAIRDHYKLGKTLGTGGFSVVKLGTEKESGKEWAVKIMTLPKAGQKPTEEQNTREEIFYEIDILCNLKHPNVMGLKEYFEEDEKVYLVTELLTGGELLDAVIDRGNYTEEDARLVRTFPAPPSSLAPSLNTNIPAQRRYLSHISLKTSTRFTTATRPRTAKRDVRNSFFTLMFFREHSLSTAIPRLGTFREFPTSGVVPHSSLSPLGYVPHTLKFLWVKLPFSFTFLDTLGSLPTTNSVTRLQ
jgi:hypothetical protein